MAKKKLSPEVQAIISAMDAGQFSTAVVLVKKFLDANPESQRGWLDLGHALSQLARYSEAEKAFQQAIELAKGEDCDVIYGQLGNLHKNQGDLNTAAAYYQKQIDADPTDATGYVFLSNVLMRQSKHDEVEAVLSRALGCQIGILEEVHYSLGLHYRNINELHKSQKHLNAALQLDPNYAQAKIAMKDVKTTITLTS
jgi:superkiller protein 3